MMPLALLGVGESGTITDIRGKEDVIHHLHNLGFAAGTDVEVVGNTDAGMIIAVTWRGADQPPRRRRPGLQ